MRDLTISFGRVTQLQGSRRWGRQLRVPHEPPMYWAHRGETRPLGPDYFHYGDTPWTAIFDAIGRERHRPFWEQTEEKK